MIPQQLESEVAHLMKVGYSVEIISGAQAHPSRVYVLFKDFILPETVYNMTSTDLIVWTTNQYPSSSFDMFWVDERLTFANGTIPNAATLIEQHINRRWRRFSIHPYRNNTWNPSSDNLETYLMYVSQRLNAKI